MLYIDVNFIISKYLVVLPLKLKDWINLDNISWWNLSSNSSVIHLLEKNLDKIVWVN